MAEFPEHLDLTVGEERTATLPGLGTAGYIWQARVSGSSDAIEVSWVRGFTPGTEPAAIGVSAPEVVTIRAVHPGEAAVSVVHVRPWQPDGPPIDERRLVVRVSGPETGE